MIKLDENHMLMLLALDTSGSMQYPEQPANVPSYVFRIIDRRTMCVPDGLKNHYDTPEEARQDYTIWLERKRDEQPEPMLSWNEIQKVLDSELEQIRAFANGDPSDILRQVKSDHFETELGYVTDKLKNAFEKKID